MIDVAEADNAEETHDGADECGWLRRKMKKIIEREDYERAAELRYMINRIQGEQDGNRDR